MSLRQRQPADARAHYPDLARDVGEDPARFLDTSELALAEARIRGIRSVRVIERWIEVEADLARGPRKSVIGALNRRKSTLQEVEA